MRTRGPAANRSYLIARGDLSSARASPAHGPVARPCTKVSDLCLLLRHVTFPRPRPNPFARVVPVPHHVEELAREIRVTVRSVTRRPATGRRDEDGVVASTVLLAVLTRAVGVRIEVVEVVDHARVVERVAPRVAPV